MALTDNVINYWKLDESSGNAADSVGSVTLTNTNVSYVAGKINNGADFNGSNTRLTGTFTNPSTNFSFSVWIKPDALPTSNNFAAIVSKYSTAASTGGFSLGLFNNAGTHEIRNTFYNSVTGLDASPIYIQTLTTGTWYHFVCTFDTSVGGKMYMNGSQVASVNDTGDLLNPAGRSLTVGYQNYDGSTNVRFFDGIIDEVGFWDRTLSSTEVTALYNSGNGLQYPFSTTAIKTINGLAKASVKTMNGLAIASVKTLNGLA